MHLQCRRPYDEMVTLARGPACAFKVMSEISNRTPDYRFPMRSCSGILSLEVGRAFLPRWVYGS